MTLDPSLANLPPNPRLGRSTRLALAGWAVALMALLGVARWLQPDPKGFGTHTQLGLWPCAFRETTGRPCPTCGMTTAFAWFARGDFARSWRSNPASLFLAPTCVLLVPWLLLIAARGRAVGTRSLETPLISLAVATVGLTVVSWTIRLFIMGGR